MTSSMKIAAALVAFVLLACGIIGMPMLMESREEGGQTAANEEILQSLISERSPAGTRQITFLVADRLQAPFILQPNMGKPIPGFDGWSSWFGRSSKDPGYAAMLGVGTPLPVWYLDTRLWAVKRNETIHSLASQILAARKAQARVNLVAEGEGALIAVSALMELEKMAGPGERPVLAKAAFLGNNIVMLRSLPGLPADNPATGASSSLIQEMGHFWINPSEGSFGSPAPLHLTAFTEKFHGQSFQGNDLLGFAPDVPQISDEDTLKAVGKMIHSQKSMEQFMGLEARALAAASSATAAALAGDAAAAAQAAAADQNLPMAAGFQARPGGGPIGSGPIAGGPISQSPAPTSSGPMGPGGSPSPRPLASMGELGAAAPPQDKPQRFPSSRPRPQFPRRPASAAARRPTAAPAQAGAVVRRSDSHGRPKGGGRRSGDSNPQAQPQRRQGPSPNLLGHVHRHPKQGLHVFGQQVPDSRRPGRQGPLEQKRLQRLDAVAGDGRAEVATPTRIPGTA